MLVQVKNYLNKLFPEKNFFAMSKRSRTIKMVIMQATLTLFYFFKVYGQELPKIIQPSPEASALFRYQNYPVDYSTGLPQIDLPIYEVKSGSLNIPISISYHASGRRVDDKDGPIGLGWTLNAGGLISRSIYGSPDFGTFNSGTHLFPHPFKTDNLSNQYDLEYLEKIMRFNHQDAMVRPWLDSEYDIFSYNIGAINGKFIFKDSNNLKTPVLLPYKPYLIKPTFTSYDLSKIELTDDKGVYYLFSPGEQYNTNNDYAVSSWVLRKVISADKADTIDFIYTTAWEERVTISQTGTLISQWEMSGEGPPFNYNETENTNRGYYSKSRLSKIKFRQGEVSFVLANNSNKNIESIQIVNSANQIIKSVRFTRSLCYSQSELGYAAFKLDALHFCDNANRIIETYSFDYYPISSANGQLNARHSDWWGYYNNSGVSTMIPYYTNVPSSGGGLTFAVDVGHTGTNRNPEINALRSGVIRKITFPTGGSTEFIYEHNRCTLYGIAGQPVNGPGMRVAQIISRDNTGTSSYRTFKYGLNENGYGAIEMLPGLDVMSSKLTTGYVRNGTGWSPDRYGTYQEHFFHSSFVPELGELAGRPVIYTEVTEYTGTETNNTGKTVYKYDNYQWAPAGMPYSERKRIYYFNYWNNPSLLSTTHFSRVVGLSGQVSFKKVKEVVNTYSITTTQVVKGLHVMRNISAPQTGRWGPKLWHIEQFLVNEPAGNPFVVPAPIYTFSGYEIPAGYKNLESTVETLYDVNGAAVSSTTSYTYNSKQLINRVASNSSKGGLIIKELTYPFDYPANATLSEMANLNMINMPIEQIEKRNNLIMKRVRTNYSKWGTTPGGFYPITIEEGFGNAPYVVKVRFHAYDSKGNVLTVSKENDVFTTYVWGYNKTYPIAEVLGVNNVALSTAVTLNQTILDNPQAGDQTVRGEIEKIRNALPASLVKTYTYKPLIGITSQTDPNGKTIFYEYDNIGRLLFVKDQDQNIVKQYCYNYQGYSENCIQIPNDALTQSFTAQCTFGSPSTVSYTIAAGSFFAATKAEANSMALSRLNTEGQAFANANGCVDCNTTNCAGPANKCINGVCQTGTYGVIARTYDGTTCTTVYGYFFSDGTSQYDRIDPILGECR